MKHKLVVFTGAGVSAESGISTFRDSGGLWDKYDPMEVASIDGWRRNPSMVMEFYNIRRRELKTVSPNMAHKLIASLESEWDVDVITQNVDNLHERGGSSKVLHLHGELTKVRTENSYNENDGYSEDGVIDVGYKDVYYGEKGGDGSLLRPHIVFFGESVPKMDRAIDIVREGEIILIIGTSLQVYPAASLYRYAPAKAKIILIDPSDVYIQDPRIEHIKLKATEGMEHIITILEMCQKSN